MKRIWSLMAVLALAVGLLFAGSTPEKAEATVTWPVKVEAEASNLRITYDGDLLFAGCRSSVGYSAGRITNEAVSYDPFPMSGSNMYCDAAMGEAIASDGTVFGTVLDSTATLRRLQAVKNGRVKWTFDLQWVDGCPGNARPWNTYNVESLSVGADGNLYFVALPTASNCPSYVVGVDVYTGEQLPITHNKATGRTVIVCAQKYGHMMTKSSYLSPPA